MSNLSTIGMILALAIVAYAIVIYASNELAKIVDTILAGVVEGVPMSKKNRQLKLYHIYVGQLGAVIAISMIMAFGFVRIAENATGSGARTLAYLCAGLGAFAALQWFVLGISYLLHCMRVLHQTVKVD
jgi:hypothetical protein